MKDSDTSFKEKLWFQIGGSGYYVCAVMGWFCFLSYEDGVTEAQFF